MSSYDDRDTALTREAVTTQQQQPPLGQPLGGQGYGYGEPEWGMRRQYGGFGRGMGMRRGPIETKPFFLTSEFLGTLLGIIAVAITAAVATDIDSRLATELITGLIAAYTLSRGIAKAGTRSHSLDPRENLTFGRTHDGAPTGAGQR
jgi:hypothetical protein